MLNGMRKWLTGWPAGRSTTPSMLVKPSEICASPLCPHRSCCRWRACSKAARCCSLRTRQEACLDATCCGCCCALVAAECLQLVGQADPHTTLQQPPCLGCHIIPIAPHSGLQDALLSYVAVVMMALEMVGVPLVPEVSPRGVEPDPQLASLSEPAP